MLARTRSSPGPCLSPEPVAVPTVEGRYWEVVAARHGGRVLEVIKERADSRTVLMVEHPLHGRCILKTTCPVRRPRQGLANLAAAKFVADSGSPIFPEILGMSSCHTLERFVDGRPFRRWMDSATDHLGIIADYFRELRAWSETGRFCTSRRRMEAGEIRWIARSYVDKCLAHAGYLRGPGRLRARWNLLRLGPRIRRRIERLDALAGHLDLPLGVMCGDMGNVNLIVDTGRGRILNIDYETLGAGHWGFDAAYFVSSVLKLDAAPGRRRMLHELALTDAHFDDPAAGDYFREVADLLADIGRAVFRPER